MSFFQCTVAGGGEIPKSRIQNIQNIYGFEADILIRLGQRGPVGGKSQNIYEFEADIFIRQGQRGASGGKSHNIKSQNTYRFEAAILIQQGQKVDSGGKIPKSRIPKYLRV